MDVRFFGVFLPINNSSYTNHKFSSNLWSLTMLISFKYLGYLIILILCLYNTSFCQLTPPTSECDNCGGTGILEGPYNTTYSIDTASGCNVTITYHKRTCNSFTNIFVTQYSYTGNSCSSFSGTDIIDRALSGFLSGNAPFPPYELTDPPAYWRVAKATCWKEDTSTSTSLIKVFIPCPSAPCCITYFGARNNNCGRIVTYIPFFYLSPVTCPPDTTCTVTSCNHDPFDAWK